MKLDPSYKKHQLEPKDAVAYVSQSGNIALHPKYFEGSWTSGNGLIKWTGYISGGKIISPDEPKKGYLWEPEEQPLENCFFEGDLLPLVL